MALNDVLNQVQGANTLTRISDQISPFISGHFLVLIEIPSALAKMKYINDRRSPDGNVTKASQWLSFAATAFTPPTRTLNRIDVPGMGGTGTSAYTGQTITREFTITFREYAGAPIYKIIRAWTNLVFGANQGGSPVTSRDWIEKRFAGTGFVAVLKPTAIVKDNQLAFVDNTGDIASANDIAEGNFEEIFQFKNIVPINEPIDTLGTTDIGASDVVMHTITFGFDTMHVASDYSRLDNNNVVFRNFKSALTSYAVVNASV